MKLFKLTETTFENYDNTVRSYLSKTLNSLGMQYTHSNIFGVIFDGVKGIMQNIMFYIEDALSEQNIFTATRKSSIYSLAKISGYEAYYGAAASGTMIGKMLVNNGLQSNLTKIYVKNGTLVSNKNNGMKYSIILPTDYYVFDITKPLTTHEFKIVQGYIAKNTFTAVGDKFETFHISCGELFDKQYTKVYVNGIQYEQVSNLYDMTEDGNEFVCTIGYDNTFDIMFGDGINGKRLNKGDTIVLEYLKHNGVMGNILPEEDTDFSFVDKGYDSFGNTIDINTYMKISVKTCISGGTNSDSIEFIRNMIGTNSRSLVLASEDNFKLFFKRFSFIGYVNCWSEQNSMYIIATCLRNLSSYLKDVESYFTIDDKSLLLTDQEKTMVVNTLENSKKSFAGITLKFQDPVIRKFAIICYVKIDNVYDQDYVRTEIKNKLATYFMNSITNTQFIAKAKLIELLTTSIDKIKAIDMTIYSDMAEQAYYNSYYYKYSFRLINGSYEYVKEKVIYEKDSTPGLDVFNNILLDSKLEMPIISNIKYYNEKELNKKTYFDMPAIQVYFV